MRIANAAGGVRGGYSGNFVTFVSPPDSRTQTESTYRKLITIERDKSTRPSASVEVDKILVPPDFEKKANNNSESFMMKDHHAAVILRHGAENRREGKQNGNSHKVKIKSATSTSNEQRITDKKSQKTTLEQPFFKRVTKAPTAIPTASEDFHTVYLTHKSLTNELELHMPTWHQSFENSTYDVGYVSYTPDSVKDKNSLLSRGRRTETSILKPETRQNKYNTYTDRDRHKQRFKENGKRSKSSKKQVKKGMVGGEWVEYDSDLLPMNPAGLKNPKLLVGPWVEEKPVPVSKAYFG